MVRRATLPLSPSSSSPVPSLPEKGREGNHQPNTCMSGNNVSRSFWKTKLPVILMITNCSSLGKGFILWELASHFKNSNFLSSSCITSLTFTMCFHIEGLTMGFSVRVLGYWLGIILLRLLITSDNSLCCLKYTSSFVSFVSHDIRL